MISLNWEIKIIHLAKLMDNDKIKHTKIENDS